MSSKSSLIHSRTAVQPCRVLVQLWQTGPSRWLLLWNQQLSEEFERNRTRQALFTPLHECSDVNWTSLKKKKKISREELNAWFVPVDLARSVGDCPGCRKPQTAPGCRYPRRRDALPILGQNLPGQHPRGDHGNSRTMETGRRWHVVGSR